MFDKIILIVLDGCGIGAAADASKYKDEGSNTLGNLAKKVKLNVPNLEKFGIGNIVEGFRKEKNPIASFGKMKEASNGKDTITGHWEMMGVITEKPFPVFPKGFPENLLKEFLKVNNIKGCLGNKAASGTEIIKELGEEHIKTGFPIVYTSADSVFQIAAHEDIIPVETLYEICRKTREILKGKYEVNRVIARPFIGKNPNFTRTHNRKDFSVEPKGKTVLDALKENNVDVVGIGKINDIFSGRGVSEYVKTKNNLDGLEKTLAYLKKLKKGFIFVNLNDFDMVYGHRRNCEGFAKALEEFDSFLPKIFKQLGNGMLIITADHGNDPTFKGTDHTRENVPLLVYNGKSVDLGTRNCFCDIGKTIAENFNLKFDKGKDFWVL